MERTNIFLYIIIVLFSCLFSNDFVSSSSYNLTLRHEHPYPEHVVQELHRRVNVSLTRRQTLANQVKDSCKSGNPIDDCWICDPNWADNRQKLADCAIGFGSKAIGGKGGPIYMVTEADDSDYHKPKPGTLRDAVSQSGPVWIVFKSDMTIDLKTELVVTSFKTIDGRGARVELTGGGCVLIAQATNVIVHNINIHDCHPSTSSDAPAKSDGDGIRVLSSSNVWIDHCTMSNCDDGLIDCTLGSTAITISNNYFFKHDKVILLGHSDEYDADRGMQVTVAFNRFGEGVGQRMPRCRHGYFHVVNNDYRSWEQYAVGGSAKPTINSQGNRYIAPSKDNVKEVTKRLNANKEEWSSWNWRSEGDLMVNGAFFVASGDGGDYSQASSMDALPANAVDQLTLNAGILVSNNKGMHGVEGGSNTLGGGDRGYLTGSAPQSPSYHTFTIIFCITVIIFFYI